MKPSMFFIPHPEAMPIHPETRAELMKPDTAYSISAVEKLCAETGIDYIQGEVCTLECARGYRSAGVIVGFVILESEEE